MQVFKDELCNSEIVPRVMTKDAMQKDFEYEMAQKLTIRLYEENLISVDELHRISALNREKFYAFYDDILD